jgi:hypothetical protein
LIAGGWYQPLGQDPVPLRSAELYDPATGDFSPTGSMGTVRDSSTATLLQDGRVLLAGGDPPDGTSAELYQP